MAGLVGSEGSVLATDFNPAWIGEEAAALVEVRQHDVTVDAIPAAEFDVIHARLVLVHLAQREAVIASLVRGLRPGGWLLLEHFDRIFPACPDPESEDEHAYTRVTDAVLELLRRRGADMTYARTLPSRLQRAGLTEVGAEGRLVFVPGATPGSELQRANLLQTGGLAVDEGLATADDVSTFLRLLDDPEFIPATLLLISSWGRRPPAH